MDGKDFLGTTAMRGNHCTVTSNNRITKFGEQPL